MSLVHSERDAEIQSEKLLVDAAATGDLDTVVSLLQLGVSVDAEEFNRVLFYASKNYLTPLQVACSNGHPDVAEALIDYGADVDAKDRFDVTAAHMAAEQGNHECLKALLNANAECSLPTKYSKNGCYTAVPHLGGTTPLHLAALNNHVDCVRELIQYGADYNAVDERGRNSLYIAAQFAFSDCVLAHLRNAVGRDILSLPSVETFDTPLHFAVTHGMVECVYALLVSGSDVNHLNYGGCSPLHLAVTPTRENRNVSMEILKMLVLNGYDTDINQKDGTDMTALHYVCFSEQSPRSRNQEMAKFLIAYGADVHIKNTRGCALLEYKLKSTLPTDYEILQYIVRSMLHLPQFPKLRVVQESSYHSSPRERFPTLFAHPAPPRERFIGDIAAALQIAAHRWERNVPFLPLPLPSDSEANPLVDQKVLWYESMASNPRTLQHCCRFTIRKALGPRSMKYIGDLPIPNALQSYLLLEYD